MGLCIPRQVPCFGLGQELEVFQLGQVGVGDGTRRAVCADVAGGVEGNGMALDVGLLYRKDFILRRGIEDAALNGIQEVILAPAVGRIAADVAGGEDEILFCLCKVRIALVLEELLAHGVVRSRSGLQGFHIAGVGLDGLFVVALGLLQVCITFGSGRIGLGSCVVIVDTMPAF